MSDRYSKIMRGQGFYLILSLLMKLTPLFLFKGYEMMDKTKQALIDMKEGTELSIAEKTRILQVYKNGNVRIPGQRSLSRGNWNRKRSMLVHHKQVRSYIKYFKFEGSYLSAVKKKGKELRDPDSMFVESLQKYIPPSREADEEAAEEMYDLWEDEEAEEDDEVPF